MAGRRKYSNAGNLNNLTVGYVFISHKEIVCMEEEALASSKALLFGIPVPSLLIQQYENNPFLKKKRII